MIRESPALAPVRTRSRRDPGLPATPPAVVATVTGNEMMMMKMKARRRESPV